MAIGDDFSITATGDIRHVSGTAHYSVLELHRWLQNLADDEQASSGDLIDITVYTPSARSTDQIIELLDHTVNSGPVFNIDDTAAEYFYGGSIKQKNGKELYSGLKVLGAVNDTTTQIMVVQDHDYYQYTTTPASPFWGTQASGGWNGDAAGGVLMRILVKSRINGADIDGKRIRLQARDWGDSYDFFAVTLGEGEAVGALGTTPDAQNDTVVGTVGAWAGGDIPTNVEGYQTIDYNNGNGATPFYSKWQYNTNAQGLKATWQWGKYITRTGTSNSIHGTDGEFFLGVTHEYAYDAGSAFTEDEIVTWGTDVTFDTGAGGNFTVGNYVVFGTSGASGKLVLAPAGTTGVMRVALEDITKTIVNDEVITEYNKTTGATGRTALVNVTILNNNKGGGEGLLLAATGTTTGTHWIQLISGVAPVDNLPLTGRTSTATALVNGTITIRTVPKVFLGSYTGSHIGAFGVGYLPANVTASDSFTNLLNATQTPPNNRQFQVFGLVSGEDRVLVAPRLGSVIDFAQFTTTAARTAAGQTTIPVTPAIPADTPQTGNIRIELDTGIYRWVAYTSWTGSTFTIGSTDFSGANAAASGANVFIGYIDKLAAASTESVTMKYGSDRNLFVRVRDGGGTPIKTYEANSAVFGSTGGSATASRISDA